MKRKVTVKRQQTRKRSVHARAQPDDSALRVDLTQEAYNLITDAVAALGVSSAQHKKALMRARNAKSRPRPSLMVMKHENEVALLLNTWRRDPRYVQADGTPKALPIAGKGATLESLAKFCVPDLTVIEVVRIICAHSDVTRMNGDKVALLGHPVKITEKSATTSLAWLITQLRHLAETVVFNAQVPANAKVGGRFERLIWGTLPKKQFDAWAQSVRERLQETSDQVEAELESEAAAAPRSGGARCGVGVYVFREDGDLG